MSQQSVGERELSHYDDDESEEQQQPPQQFSSMQMSQVTQNNKQIELKQPQDLNQDQPSEALMRQRPSAEVQAPMNPNQQ